MEAFRGCKNLKNIVIKTSDLVKQGVGTDALKGLNAKAVATVPESKLSEYKKILKNKGQQKGLMEKNRRYKEERWKKRRKYQK